MNPADLNRAEADAERIRLLADGNWLGLKAFNDARNAGITARSNARYERIRQQAYGRPTA